MQTQVEIEEEAVMVVAQVEAGLKKRKGLTLYARRASIFAQRGIHVRSLHGPLLISQLLMKNRTENAYSNTKSAGRTMWMQSDDVARSFMLKLEHLPNLSPHRGDEHSREYA